MGRMLEVSFFLLASVAILAAQLWAVTHVQKLADEQVKAWQVEYNVRLCAELQSSAANLMAAAQNLSTKHPHLGDKLRFAAEDLARRLRSVYPDALQAKDEGICVDQVDGVKISTYPHRQTHPGQPHVWPNWIYRVSPF